VREKLFKAAYLTACLALVGAGLALWVLRPPRSTAAPADVQPEARDLLEEVAKAYRSLPGYADHGRFHFSLKVNGEAQEQDTPLALAFERPGKLALETEGVRVACDGEHLVTSNSALKKYIRQDAPASVTAESIAGGPLGAMLQGSPASAPVFVLLDLLTTDKGLARLTENAESVSLEEDREVEGKPLRSVFLREENGSGVRLLIDSGSKLVRRIELVVPQELLEEKSPPGATLSDAEIAWTSGEVATASPGAEAFAFAPPADYTEVQPAEAAARAPEGAASPLVGKPAPDFRMDVLEGEKRASVSKADLKGKVVLLDFWATWCPPCREELPEIQALAERLAKRADAGKVALYAVSQDRADDGPDALRKLVASTLADLKVGGLLGGKVARVALDPDQSVGDAFGVQGIPTLVLIDAEGVVRSVQVGYREGIGEAMEAEIDALLSGKPGEEGR
jgi:thiol-disulfide isomerase/thioredoxin